MEAAGAAPMFADQPPPAVDEVALEVQNDFFDFLSSYKRDAADAEPTYATVLNEMEQSHKSTLVVDFSHILAFNDGLASALKQEFYRSVRSDCICLSVSFSRFVIRFEPYLRKATQNFIRERKPDFVLDDKNMDKEFWVSIFNAPPVVKCACLRAENILLLSVCWIRGLLVRFPLLPLCCVDCAIFVPSALAIWCRSVELLREPRKFVLS
jgi:hypothetical protein